MKHLIRVEFKRNFKSLILWTVIVALLCALMLIMFPAFQDSFSEIEDFLEGYPDGFLEAFGLGEGGLDMTNLYGWYGVEGYLFVILIGGSYAGILGGSILSKEEDDKTIEFLLSKPISRNHVFFGKAIVVLINLLIMDLVVSLVLLVSFVLMADLDVVVWLLFSFAPLLLQLVFASLSLLISIFVTKSRQVMSISLGIVIGMYVIDLISTLTDQGEFLKYITPYEYINAIDIVNNESIRFLYLMLVFGIVLVSFMSAWQLYKRKDIVA